MARFINVGNVACSISEEAAACLLKAGIIYECGDPATGHDFHLVPDGPNDAGWDLDAAENLVIAMCIKNFVKAN